MSRRTRRSSRRRSYRSWPAVRPTARSCGPAWDRRSEPRGRLRAAPWPRPAHSRHSPPSPPCSPGACEARPPACGAPGLCSGRFAAIPTHECMHPPCPWRHRYPRQRDHFVPSSTPFLARFGLEALATVRVEEDTGAVPRSVTSSVAFGRNGLSSSNGRLVRNRPFAHSDRFSGHKGAGNAGRAMRPQPRVQNKKAHEHSHHRFTGNTRPSLRNGFNGFLRALPGDRAFLPPSSPRSFASRELDTSVGASGPHDFAVRSSIIRPREIIAPDAAASIASRLNVRDDREAPLLRGGTGRVVNLICPTGKAKYFCERGWTAKSQNSLSGKSGKHHVRCEPRSIFARRNLDVPQEGASHMFFVAEAAGPGDGFDAIIRLLKPAPRGVDPNGLHRFRRRASALG